MPTRPPARKKQHAEQHPPIPDDVVARLGPVVRKVFSEQDFHRVDMRSIAREAGMSFATIYRHFRDKEALLFWFITYWLRDLYPSAGKLLDTDDGALDKLQNYLLAHLRFYEERPDIGRIIFMTVPLARWMRDETFQARESTTRVIEVIARGQASGEIRSDVSRVLVFDAWFGVFNRAFLMWEFRGRSYSLTGEWASLCAVLLHGIAGPAARRRRAGAKRNAAASVSPKKREAASRPAAARERGAAARR